MNVAKLTAGGHNILKFDFPGINLLDSVDYPKNCTRGLVFNIKAKAGLPDGTTIYNHAGIFFDYNPVVTTNTVKDIIGVAPLSAPAVAKTVATSSIYPNPAGNRITIVNQSQAVSYVISDMVGTGLISGRLTGANNMLDISSLPQGVYLLKLDSGEFLKFTKL